MSSLTRLRLAVITGYWCRQGKLRKLLRATHRWWIHLDLKAQPTLQV